MSTINIAQAGTTLGCCAPCRDLDQRPTARHSTQPDARPTTVRGPKAPPTASIATSTATDGLRTSLDPARRMRSNPGRPEGSSKASATTTDHMVDRLWGPRGALQRRAQVRTLQNYREVFPLLKAVFTADPMVAADHVRDHPDLRGHQPNPAHRHTRALFTASSHRPCQIRARCSAD
jgi:hypothetical protein